MSDRVITERCVCGGTARWEGSRQTCDQPACMFYVAPEGEDTSDDYCTEHGFTVCPDCGNGGVKITSDGYVSCTRFLGCWADPDPIDA